MHAVIADDDEDTRGLVREALSSFTVHEAATGVELLEQVALARELDLIVTDIDMGSFDGIQAVASVRSAGIAVPIIVITGSSEPGTLARVAQLPNAMLLRKPFSLAELRAHADRLTRQRDDDSSARGLVCLEGAGATGGATNLLDDRKPQARAGDVAATAKERIERVGT